MDIEEIEAAFWDRPLTREEITFLEEYHADDDDVIVCHACGDRDYYCELCGFHGHLCKPIEEQKEEA